MVASAFSDWSSNHFQALQDQCADVNLISEDFGTVMVSQNALQLFINDWL